MLTRLAVPVQYESLQGISGLLDQDAMVAAAEEAAAAEAVAEEAAVPLIGGIERGGVAAAMAALDSGAGIGVDARSASIDASASIEQGTVARTAATFQAEAASSSLADASTARRDKGIEQGKVANAAAVLQQNQDTFEKKRRASNRWGRIRTNVGASVKDNRVVTALNAFEITKTVSRSATRVRKAVGKRLPRVSGFL